MPNLILDRDGVINHDSANYIRSVADFSLFDDVILALQLAQQKGYRLFIASNQAGLARNKFDSRDLAQIHQHLFNLLQAQGILLEAIFFCPHLTGCECRKPQPGLLNIIQLRFADSLNYFVGDSWRDLQAAANAGCMPLLVKTGNGYKTYTDHFLTDLPTITPRDMNGFTSFDSTAVTSLGSDDLQQINLVKTTRVFDNLYSCVVALP